MTSNNNISAIAMPSVVSSLGKLTTIPAKISQIYASVQKKIASIFDSGNSNSSTHRETGVNHNPQSGTATRVGKFISKTSLLVGVTLGSIGVAQAANTASPAQKIAPAASASQSRALSHATTLSGKKELARKNQIIIDAGLKKLLQLQGLKPDLKHEGVPSGVKNYGTYITQQYTSITRINAQIKKLSLSSAKGVKVVTQKAVTQNAIPLATDTPSTLVSSEPLIQANSTNTAGFDNKNDSGVNALFILPDPLAPTAASQPILTGTLDSGVGIPPVMPSVIDLKDTITTHTPTSGDLLEAFVLELPSIPASGSVVSAPIIAPNKGLSTGNARSDTQSPGKQASGKLRTSVKPAKELIASKTLALPANALKPKKGEVKILKAKLAKGSVIKHSKKATPTRTAPIEAGLTPSTLTSTKLAEFLTRVNTTLSAKNQKNAQLKGASFSQKTITVKRKVLEDGTIVIKSVPAIRVTLKQGKHTAYATFPPPQKDLNYAYTSPNYSRLASVQAMIDWAERYCDKWAKTKV